MRNIKQAAALLIILAALPFFCGCRQGRAAEDESSYVFVMGTVFEIRAIGTDVKSIISDAEQVLYDCDKEISWRQEGSLTDAFNKTHEQDMSAVDEMIRMALQISEDSDGAFDITVLPVSRVWDFDRFGEADFDPAEAAVPDDSLISEALSGVGSGKLLYDPESHMLRSSDTSVQIELGAIGKGYAADQAVRVLQEAGVTGGMINAGSTITVTGKKADGTDFHVAVRDPRGEIDDYIGVLTVSDAAIATSGDYERFFEQDGVRYHHILDPRTGYPADSGLMQVTIICDNSMLADALSTACFVLGLEKGMALADRYQVMALFVDRDRQVWYNSSKIPDILDFSGEDQGYTLKAYE